MNADQIREKFLLYFEKHGHRIIRSSSLIPANDPTLLFTNAGMNQFKDYFLGNVVPEFNRAVTCQKVMRAGGKHNDLENVGRTARHHTFFEMLGFFSFGDYFKDKAIRFSWDFLTKDLGIPEDKLAVSVFETDDVAYNIWHNEIGVPKEKIARLGEEDNFWAMGNVGPCGPCSEIYYDLNGDNGKTPIQCLTDDDGRFLEVWNLVFMQFERKSDGQTIPLPKPSIDTGMGLERIASVLENVKSNYDTTLFKPLLLDIAERANYQYGTKDEKDVSCKVISDHVRALAFLITDGLIPGNDGRGYVMRRILRRASRHARYLNGASGFLSETVPAVVLSMKKSYPEMDEMKEYIQKIILTEEQRFSGTLTQGLKHLDRIIDETVANKKSSVPGAEIFKLYDTYGFPPDLADDILQDRHLEYSLDEYDAEMEIQKENARKAQQGTRINKKILPVYKDLQAKSAELNFSGYDKEETITDSVCLIQNENEVSEVNAQDEFELILADTPFYAEGGGQIGDRGYIENDYLKLKVNDTFKPFPGIHISRVKALIGNQENKINLGQFKNLKATVDPHFRHDTEIHHTATHLLHNGLRRVLGEHVKQAGSLVENNRLRFDFSHYESVNSETIKIIEEYINELVRKNYSVTTEELAIEEALNKGALAFFGEKYGDKVRMVSAGPSVELCGGCHVKQTAEISFIKIVSEESVASGIRRVEALAGEHAATHIMDSMEQLQNSAQLLGVKPKELHQKIYTLEETLKTVKRQNKTLKDRLFTDAVDSGKFTRQAGNVRFICYSAEPDDNLSEWATLLLKRNPENHVCLLYSADKNQINVVLTVSQDLCKKFRADSLIKEFSPLINAKGGGKETLARCGGTNPEGIERFISALTAKISA